MYFIDDPVYDMEGIHCNHGIGKVFSCIVDEWLAHVCNQVFYLSAFRYIDTCKVLLGDNLPSAGEKTRGNNELKLFLFMLWKFYSGDIFMSQEKLGQHIGVARNTVCEIVSRLEEKHFLEIHKSRRNGSFFECCEYVLLR